MVSTVQIYAILEHVIQLGPVLALNQYINENRRGISLWNILKSNWKQGTSITKEVNILTFYLREIMKEISID